MSFKSSNQSRKKRSSDSSMETVSCAEQPLLSRLQTNCVPTGVSKPHSSASPGEVGSILIVTVVAHPGIGRYVKYRNFNESCVKTEQIVISPFPCISHLLYEKKNINLAVNWEKG